MQLFDENTKRTCCCNDALNKGIYTKSLSYDNFCIYGNLMQDKSILLNYYGKLINDNSSKNEAPNIYLYYCFDNNWNEKKIVNMNICNRNSKLTYCAIIDIPEISTINVAFTNDNDEWDTDKEGTYYLKIYPDIEKAIIKRYGLDSTPPTVLCDNLPTITFKERIHNFFSIFKLKKKACKY